VPSKAALDANVFDKAYEALESQFDPTYGGFGGAPKFPNPMSLSFLLRYWKKTHSDQALSMVEMTLEKMASGGLYDQIGGGFHRYSVDDHWLIPHFERCSMTMPFSAKFTQKPTRPRRRRGTGACGGSSRLRPQRDDEPRGRFLFGQDADSEGKEGKFYVWTQDEINKILERRREHLSVPTMGDAQRKLRRRVERSSCPLFSGKSM